MKTHIIHSRIIHGDNGAAAEAVAGHPYQSPPATIKRGLDIHQARYGSPAHRPP